MKIYIKIIELNEVLKKLKTENNEKKLRESEKIEKKELKLSKLTLELEQQNFTNNNNSEEYQNLIQNIKETQNDLFSLEKDWYELEEKSANIED